MRQASNKWGAGNSLNGWKEPTFHHHLL